MLLTYDETTVSKTKGCQRSSQSALEVETAPPKAVAFMALVRWTEPQQLYECVDDRQVVQLLFQGLVV